MIVMAARYSKQDSRLVRALRNSVAANMPAALFRISKPDPPDRKDHHRFVPKVRAWDAGVAALAPGEEMMLIDADCVVLQDPSAVFDREFDIAITVRPGPTCYNTGVMFIRGTEAAQRFMSRWLESTAWIARQADRVARARAEWAGADQASLAEVLADMRGKVRVERLPCVRWNCCEPAMFDQINEQTKILHLKGKYHRDVLVGGEPGGCKVAGDAWRRFDSDPAEEGST